MAGTYPPRGVTIISSRKNSRLFAYVTALVSATVHVVVLGFVIGLKGPLVLQHATEASEYTLIFIVPGGDLSYEIAA